MYIYRTAWRDERSLPWTSNPQSEDTPAPGRARQAHNRAMPRFLDKRQLGTCFTCLLQLPGVHDEATQQQSDSVRSREQAGVLPGFESLEGTLLEDAARTSPETTVYTAHELLNGRAMLASEERTKTRPPARMEQSERTGARSNSPGPTI
jgi:hypothetical protein